MEVMYGTDRRQDKKIKNGEVIIKENTWAYYVYFLKEGNARVVKNVDGRQVTIGTLIKGDIFGEMSFLGRADEGIFSDRRRGCYGKYDCERHFYGFL